MTVEDGSDESFDVFSKGGGGSGSFASKKKDEPPTAEFAEAKAFMDADVARDAAGAEGAAELEAVSVEVGVSEEGSGSLTDDDIERMERLLGISGGSRDESSGAEEVAAEVGAQVGDKPAAEEVSGGGFSALDFLGGDEGGIEEGREKSGSSVESGEELVELDVSGYQGETPGQTPAASGDGAGLFENNALVGEAEAEHAGVVAAGRRLEELAAGAPARGVEKSDDPLFNFDDADDVLAKPFAVDERGAAVVPGAPASAGDAGQEKTIIDSKQRLGVDDKTEIDSKRRLEARVDAEKKSRIGMETGEFEGDAAFRDGEVSPAKAIGSDSAIIAPKDLNIGDLVAGTYEIKRRLSAGGMGALYAARDHGLGRDVAVKVILKLSENKDEAKEQVDRFKAEGNAMATVAHVGLAQVYGAGVSNGTPYLVMELCHGGDLKEQIAAHGLPSGKQDSTRRMKSDSSKRDASASLKIFDVLKAGARRATRQLMRSKIEDVVVQSESVSAPVQTVPQDESWTVQGHTSLIKNLAGALSVVHKKGVVHRDLKPANVMYADADRTRPVVIDFGLVPLKNERKDVIFGTPVYMSPEQARSDPSLDHRTDIYSLGAIYYELLTGKLPYQDKSKAKNPNEVIERIIMDRLTPAKELNPAVDAELSAIVSKMMAKDLMIDKTSLRAQVILELEARPDFADLTDEEKEVVVREHFEEAYKKECESKKKDAEGTYYRYESMDEVISDIDRYEKGLPVLAFAYTDAERKAKELKYWEKMNPEEARAKREEEERARKWSRNKRVAGVGAAVLVLAWMGNRVNEWMYSRSAQATVNSAHASVVSIADRAKRDGVARISTDLAMTIAQVSSAESLVSEWVVRQRTADAAQGQVRIQEDKRTVDSLQDSVRKYNDARVLLEEYRRARGESDFARAYQSIFSAYQLSREAVAEETGVRGLDDARARALVDEVARLRDNAINRRGDYARERIEAYETRLKALYKARFLRQLPGGAGEFTSEYERARSDLARELDNPPAVDLQRVTVTPEMRSNWSRLEREALRSAEELEAELRSVPGLEQGIILGARAEQHRAWVEYVNTVQRRVNTDESRQFFDEIRSRYRALKQDASLSEEQYLREGAALRERINAYERGALEPKPEAEAPKRRRVR